MGLALPQDKAVKLRVMQVVAAALTRQDPAGVPWGWSERFRMPLYKPGTRVRHDGAWATVSHITLRRHGLSVYLVGQPEPVDPEKLELEPTVFATRRLPQTA